MLENEKADIKESAYGKNEGAIDALNYIYLSNIIKKAMRKYIGSICSKKEDLE